MLLLVEHDQIQLGFRQGEYPTGKNDPGSDNASDGRATVRREIDVATEEL